MVDILLILVIIAMVVAAVVHIIKGKKQGKSCAGCPMSDNCNKKCHHN